jgi:DNA-directed RNA polymerase specialized sigma24 family protein
LFPKLRHVGYAFITLVGLLFVPEDRVTEFQLIFECQSARRRSDTPAYDEAFGRLYTLHKTRLQSIARRITRNLEDADEVTNDAFRDLDRKILIVDPDKGCFGLLRQFAFRRAAEKYATNMTRLTEGYDPEMHHEPVDPGGTGEDRLLAAAGARLESGLAERLTALTMGRQAGAPNERMTFLFCRTLGYKPARMTVASFSVRKLGADNEVSGARLPALELELEQQWVERSLLQPARIARLFEPLREDLSVALCAYPMHGSTRILYKESPVWEIPISEGRLCDYFRTDPETDDIRKWCVNVERRIVKSMAGLRTKSAAGREAV